VNTFGTGKTALTQISTPAVYDTYIQKGTNVLSTIIKNHFEKFNLNYEEKYAKKNGTFRLERISKFAENYKSCGDYRKGIARIQCTNPDCKHEIFRPFSCKKFYFCPSCSQKRAILFGEHISNEVMLKLPHRQFVFTFPKMLRPFFRNNKKLLSEVSKIIYKMFELYNARIGCKEARTGIITAFQTFGDFLRYNPHYHSLVLDGYFDASGNFIYSPIKDTNKMTEYFRKVVIKHFVENGYITREQGLNLLSWKHSGFSIDNSVQLLALDNKAREALGQYIARCPVSLQKLLYEPFKGEVIFKTRYNAYFKENLKVFTAEDFIAELTQHIPPARVRLIRHYGLYSSKSRGKWKDWLHIVKLAPDGWREQNGLEDAFSEDCVVELETTSGCNKSNQTWARLIQKIYEIDPMTCPKCGSDMKVIAVITDLYEVRKILKHLLKTGKAPPGLDKAGFLDSTRSF
jgi:hypothetical protein